MLFINFFLVFQSQSWLCESTAAIFRQSSGYVWHSSMLHNGTKQRSISPKWFWLVLVCHLDRRKPVTPFSKIINEKVQQLKRKRDRQKEREKRRQQKEAEIKAMVKDSTLTTGDISSSRSSGANNQHKAANNFASRASRIAVRKREDELMRSQRKINWDINQRLLKYRSQVFIVD